MKSILLIVLLLAGLGVSTACAHPGHAGHAEARVNREAGRLEVSLRLDAVGLEQALRRRAVGGALETVPDAEYAAWLNDVFRVRPRHATADLPLRWVGREIGDPWVWLYFDLPWAPDLRAIAFENTALFDVHLEQTNTLDLIVGPVRRRAVFRPAASSVLLELDDGTGLMALRPSAPQGTGSVSVLIVTGVGEDARAVAGLVAARPDEWTVRTVALPASDADAPAPTPDDWRDAAWRRRVASALAAWLDGRSTRFVLVGHGLGAHIVAEAAAATPDRVRGVVLVDDLHPWLVEAGLPEGDARRAEAERVSTLRSRQTETQFRRRCDAMLGALSHSEVGRRVWPAMARQWGRAVWERYDLEWFEAGAARMPVGLGAVRVRTGITRRASGPYAGFGLDVLVDETGAERVAERLAALAESGK